MLKFKILISSLFLLLTGYSNSLSQSLEKELVRADSLYENKQYINAIKIFKKVYEEGKYTPSMLLKIARIEEGMGNQAESMYFLEKYYQVTKDESVLDYLKKSSKKSKAVGFDYGLSYKADLFYKEWKLQLQMAIALLMLICTILLIENRKKPELKKRYFAVNIFAFILLAFTNNYEGKTQAVIIKNPSFVMEGPSSGANLVEKIQVPTKVQIKEQVDVWNKVIYKDHEAYVKSTNIKRL